VGLVADADERAHHLAVGAEGPDADPASALEEAAGRAHASGAVTAAAELAEEARRLTPSDHEDARHRRTIQAASCAFAAGESGRAHALLENALAEAPPGPRRAEVRYWLGQNLTYEGDRRLAIELFRSALAEAGDDLSLRAGLEAGIADALFLMRVDLPAAAEHALSAVAYAERIGDRSAQIEALGQFGPKAKAALPPLRKLLDDEEDAIATAALHALEKIEGK
jgi:tetratricopeptide (TPR) repeat protein